MEKNKKQRITNDKYVTALKHGSKRETYQALNSEIKRLCQLTKLTMQKNRTELRFPVRLRK